MGIFGALTNAVTGLRAQSYALENISGNIANSQTTAFKRVETSFQDMIPDSPANKQLSGSVVATSRSTNTVQGDIQNASIGTFMAVNGDGYFVIQKPANFVDNRPIFDGVDLYTRRGDFRPDKDGYLVNGAGYYLMGMPVDSATGNPIGSVPQVLQFKNDFLPAQPTTQIEYRANLASTPLTSAHNASVPGSELLNPATLAANPLVGAPAAAKITGFGATLNDDAPAVVTGTQDLTTFDSGGALTTLSINGTAVSIPINSDANDVAAAINANATLAPLLTASVASNRLVLTGDNNDLNIQIDNASTSALLTGLGLAVGTTQAVNLLSQNAVTAGDTMDVTIGGTTTTITFGTGAGEVSTLADLNGPDGLAGLTGGTGSVDTDGNISITANAGQTIDVTASNSMALAFGIHTLQAIPSNLQVVGQDVTSFISQTISGGAITAYDASGAAVNVQLRWGKVASSATGGADTWNLFYQSNSAATGASPAWQNVGVNYTFGLDGKMNPLVSNVTLDNLTVDGVSLGSVQLVHGAGGMTQFADSNGNAQVNLLKQDGFAAGELQSVEVSDKGRIVGSYSNGRSIDLAEVTLANFNGPDYLKRIDGGAFEVTDGSGPALYGASGKIIGSALEGSNTDIADEFTKLIVTQQAYSANTKIVTTTNEMVQDLLNILR